MPGTCRRLHTYSCSMNVNWYDNISNIHFPNEDRREKSTRNLRASGMHMTCKIVCVNCHNMYEMFLYKKTTYAKYQDSKFCSTENTVIWRSKVVFEVLDQLANSIAFTRESNVLWNVLALFSEKACLIFRQILWSFERSAVSSSQRVLFFHLRWCDTEVKRHGNIARYEVCTLTKPPRAHTDQSKTIVQSTAEEQSTYITMQFKQEWYARLQCGKDFATEGNTELQLQSSKAHEVERKTHNS